jgi:excisionase family DNA binding protein
MAPARGRASRLPTPTGRRELRSTSAPSRLLPNPDPTELLTIEEVAGRLKVREKTVWDWIGRGELDAYKIGKEWRVRRDHLERHIEARRVGAQPAATGGLWDPDSAA